MSPKIHQGKTPSQTAAAPARVLKPPRPFTDPAARTETTQTPDPDFAARIERAARFGHSLDRIAAPADRPSPPGGPVVQRVKRKQTGNDGNEKKKQKTTDQRPITSFFKPKNQQQPVPTPPILPSPQQILPTTPSVSSKDSDPGSVSNLVSMTNSTLMSNLNPVPKIGKEEISTPPQTKEQEPKKKFSFSELQKQKKQKIKSENPHLANVPVEWIELGTHNPGGPPIHLKPPRHQGPSKETMAQKEKHASPYIIDLSTGKFDVYDQKEKKTKTYEIDGGGVERGNLTRSDVRNYAMLTNAYLSSLPQSPIAQQTNRREKGSIGQDASEIAKQERTKNKTKYGKGNVVAHVPDSSISGVPYSPMGFMRMTNDANTIVGYSSGIGLKAYKKDKIGSVLVREKGGQFHYYSLPSNTNDDTPSTTISNTNSSKDDALPDKSISYIQDDFWDDEAFNELDKIETSHTKPQPKDENDYS